ncbi:MAG: 50S ribosomal protein L10 [bacterium]
MRKAEKIKLSEEYREFVDSSAGLILFGYRGLSVEALTDLRRGMRSEGATVRVVRNRMLKRATEDLPFAEISEYMEGPTAITFASKDPAAVAKVLVEFSKSHPELQVGCGVVEGRIIPPERVSYLAQLPSREVLLAQILSGILSPMTGLASGFVGLHRDLLGLIEAYRAKLEEAA